MHLISYINPNDDPHAVLALLRQRYPQAERVAMRAGWMWRQDTATEGGFTHIHAPGYPAITAAYIRSGCAAADPVSLPRYTPPNEITELPQHAEISILSAGPNLRQELAAVPSRGVRMAINRAHVVGCAWHIANDGFSIAGMLADGDPVRACRQRHAASIPGGSWFNLERLGIHEGILTPVCALRLAVAMGARIIWLYGHDLIPGPGVAGNGHESANALRDIATTVDAEMAVLRAAGIIVHRIIVQNGAVTIDGQPAAAPEPQPEPEHVPVPEPSVAEPATMGHEEKPPRRRRGKR